MNAGRPGRTAVAAGLLPPVLVTAVVGGVYVVVDAGVERHAGSGVAAAAATAVAAAIAVPVHRWARAMADRLAGGSRPASYRVLAALAALPLPPTRGVPDLGTVVEAVGRGLGAGACTLTVRRPGLRDRVQTWHLAGAEPAEARWAEVPVRHGGEDVGTLAVDRVSVAGTSTERRQLLEAVASSLGVVLQATRSGIELERQLRAALAHATEIAAARRRAVAESDSERRRIERDLHDGAQHHLVSLSLGLGLVEHALVTGRLDQARAGLDQIAAQTDAVAELLARTTAGVTAPVLAEAGLVAALRAEFAQDALPVALDAPGVTRFPAEVETAVYFCCLEAVNNARKHAPGARVRVRLAVDGCRLSFAVQDDGPGWVPSADAPSSGRGIRNVTARIAAVGGHVAVRSTPGHGTTVEGSVPIPEPAPARPATGPPVGPGLRDEVRTLVRSARDAYHGTPEADRLQTLARSLDEPLRIAVTGSPGAPAALAGALAEALAAEPSSAVRYLHGAEPEAADRPAGTAAEAYVLVLDGTRPADGDLVLRLPGRVRPTQAVGVLVGEGRNPTLRRVCQAVVALRPGVGPPAEASPGDGELARVRDLVDTRLGARAGALKARTVLAALATVLRSAPSHGDVRSLLYRLDEIRSGAHELAELDLLDALCSGELPVPDEQRRAAERLLGADGVDAEARLGCAPGAGPAELARAAEQQLATWQRTATHPASSAATRSLAGSLVRTCERLLSASSGPA